jgi:hypothetical protein
LITLEEKKQFSLKFMKKDDFALEHDINTKPAQSNPMLRAKAL